MLKSFLATIDDYTNTLLIMALVTVIGSIFISIAVGIVIDARSERQLIVACAHQGGVVVSVDSRAACFKLGEQLPMEVSW